MAERVTLSREDVRRELAQGDAMLEGIGPILGHLLSATDHSLFSDEIIARVRGMLSDLAHQILRTQAEATGQKGRESFADRHSEALYASFQASPKLLAHCHATAIEWQVAQKLELDLGVDPVLSPMLQALIADEDGATSSGAMAALAAQARFAQAQRRMELPLGELPGDLFHEALVVWRDYCGEASSDANTRAEGRLRHEYDESRTRLSLLARLVSNPQERGRSALLLEEAGAGLFFSALAIRSGQTRDLAVLSSHSRQIIRLALGLRAAGLKPGDIDDVLLKLHPGAAPVAGLEELETAEARSMLLEAGPRTGLR